MNQIDDVSKATRKILEGEETHPGTAFEDDSFERAAVAFVAETAADRPHADDSIEASLADLLTAANEDTEAEEASGWEATSPGGRQ